MSTSRSFRVSDFFTPTNGHPRYIRDYVDANPGIYPVYSAALETPFGFIDDFDYVGDHLSWVMNGYGGRMRLLKGPFSANRDRGVLVPLEGVRIPNLTYLRYVLEPEFMSLAVGRRVDGRKNEYTKIYPPVASDISFELPVRADGSLDYCLMDTLGERLARIEAARARLDMVQADLVASELAFVVDPPYIEIRLSDERLFKLSIGKRLLRTEVESERSDGAVPVFSANVRTPFGYVDEGKSDGQDFSQASLIWGIDGIFDWNMIPAYSAFVPTDHCGRAVLLSDQLDPEYLLYALRASRAQYGFDRVYRASLGNLRSDVTVCVPLDNEGEISVTRQRQIAEGHRQALGLKSASLDRLDGLRRIRVGMQ